MIRVEGVLDVRRRFRHAIRDIAEGTERGLRNGGNYLMEQSLLVVPLDQGPLTMSAKVTPRGSGLQTVVIVSYDTPYAVRQHETSWYRHLPGRTDKYLERPMREKRGRIFQIVADEVYLKR